MLKSDLSVFIVTSSLFECPSSLVLQFIRVLPKVLRTLGRSYGRMFGAEGAVPHHQGAHAFRSR